jgi:spore germination cell wall hydrolase CwlJ-like protein
MNVGGWYHVVNDSPLFAGQIAKPETSSAAFINTAYRQPLWNYIEKNCPPYGELNEIFSVWDHK